ncbi:glycosyltransferase family 4 protein [Cytobacillus sp. IB215665]|uniref:glycosyltransferase family 4 protein n=1 Tax=Cytobacillus sp. IB215665 TaxID=3097357 RepID=UPI002A124017|nr:glycosyltransferase family 4 protein [Cytobacillus sp. IB215665]MDX8364505.1 glycosyltransferase family 4 protein [Cytobacillus sp. IB215665]
MRILLTTFWNYPHVGGLSNYITNLKHGMENRGHVVEITCPNEFDGYVNTKNNISDYLWKFYQQRYGKDKKKFFQLDVNFYTYLTHLSQQNLEGYDILHAQDLATANILGILNEHYEKPLLYTPHGILSLNRIKFKEVDKDSLSARYFIEIDKKAVQYADKIIILSDHFREPLKQLGAHDSKMLTVHTGIEENEEIKQPKDENPHQTIISCIARLTQRKGHHILLEALNMIKEHLDHVEIRIIGDGKTREDLEQQARHLRLSNVVFLGSRDDIPQLLKETDIFVLPTINDSLPISIIEAMHMGLPIVSSYVGGIPELIHHQKEGLLSTPGDIETLSKHLLLLIQNPSLRNELGENARKFAQAELTVNEMSRKIEQEYQSLL